MKGEVEKVTRTNFSPSKLGLPKGLPLARVIRVKSGSPAKLAGMRNNDMLMSVGSVSATTEKVEGQWPVDEKFRRFKDRNMSVGITRKGHARTLTLRPTTWAGQGLVGIDYTVFNYMNVVVESSADKTKTILKGSSRDQENSVKRKEGRYANGPEVQQPVVLQPGSAKRKGGKEYGVTFDFNKQTEPEMKDSRIKEIKTATAICDFGANGDAGGSLSFSAGEDVEIPNDSGEYWWQGVNDQGDEGWFPKCIVTLGLDTQADREGKDAFHPSNGDLQHKA